MTLNNIKRNYSKIVCWKIHFISSGQFNNRHIHSTNVSNAVWKWMKRVKWTICLTHTHTYACIKFFIDWQIIIIEILCHRLHNTVGNHYPWLITKGEWWQHYEWYTPDFDNKYWKWLNIRLNFHPFYHPVNGCCVQVNYTLNSNGIIEFQFQLAQGKLGQRFRNCLLIALNQLIWKR